LLSTNAIVKNEIKGPAIVDTSIKNETITFSTKKQMRSTLEALSWLSPKLNDKLRN
jgi:hypothetical protein